MCVLIESEKLKNNRPVTMHSLIRLCLHPLAGGKGGQSCRISACALGRGWWLFFFPLFFPFLTWLPSHLRDFHYFCSSPISLSANEHFRTCWTHLDAPSEVDFFLTFFFRSRIYPERITHWVWSLEISKTVYICSNYSNSGCFWSKPKLTQKQLKKSVLIFYFQV